MKNFRIKAIILSLVLLLAGCAANTPRENKLVATTAGAAAGTALGAASGPSPGPVTVVGMGALVGALIGFSYGNPMEQSDKEKAFKAIATGQAATWQNPTTQVTYTIIPAANYVAFNGNPLCRRFTATQTSADGATRKIFRTACQEAQGQWQLVHEG